MHEWFADVELARIAEGRGGSAVGLRVAFALHSSEALVSPVRAPVPRDRRPARLHHPASAETDRLEYVWYGAYGQEIVIPLQSEQTGASSD
jgi:hypothetical protein